MNLIRIVNLALIIILLLVLRKLIWCLRWLWCYYHGREVPDPISLLPSSPAACLTAMCSGWKKTRRYHDGLLEKE